MISPQHWRSAGSLRRLLLFAVLALVLAAAFVAYTSPALLFDWVNLRYCG